MDNANEVIQDDKSKDKDITKPTPEIASTTTTPTTPTTKPIPTTDTTKPQPKPTPASIAHKVANTLTTGDSTPANTESEKISANARVVILGLFALVGFLVLLFTVTAIGAKEQLSDVMVQVYTAAITGAFTLGGVLITQLWGK